MIFEAGENSEFKMSFEDLKKLCGEYGLNEKQIRQLVKHQVDVLKFDKDFYTQRENLLKELFDFNKEDIANVLQNCPRVFFRNELELINIQKSLTSLFSNV